MKEYEYIVWQEDKYFVSQCLNANVSWFGETADEAIANLKEAVELYFEDEDFDIPVIENFTFGRETVYA